MSARARKSVSKKSLVVLFSIIVVFLIVGVVIYSRCFHVSKNDVVVTVNGYSITAQELQREMSRDKSYVITYFQEEYDAKVEGDFWNTKFGDVTPNEYLREYALENLIAYKVEQELAVSYGLMKKKDTTYQSFLKQMEEENALRAKKLANGEVVYGAKSYTENTYFSYTYSNMQLQLQELMSQEGEPLYASETQVQEWYETVKEERYVAAETMELETYSILLENSEESVANEETGESGSQQEKEAMSMLEQVKQDLQNGVSAEELQIKYPSVTYQETSIDDENAGNWQKTSMTFYKKADALQPGDVSDVLYDRNTYMVMKCISKEEGGYKDFNEYQSGITKEYTSEKYTEYVGELVNKAEVVRKEILKKVVEK